jgi:hypothetical protein
MDAPFQRQLIIDNKGGSIIYVLNGVHESIARKSEMTLPPLIHALFTDDKELWHGSARKLKHEEIHCKTNSGLKPRPFGRWELIPGLKAWVSATVLGWVQNPSKTR